MKEEMINRFMEYLEGMQMYCNILEIYFQKEELDDFDKDYLKLYYSFKDYVKEQFDNQNSPLMQLAKNYQEFVVEYKDSLLCGCIEALNRGYSRQQVYNEGKKAVYLSYLKTKYDYDGHVLFEEMSDDEFNCLEEGIFCDEYIKKVIKR